MPQPQPRWTTAGEVAQVDLPPGGSTGQVLAKTSDVDREVAWTSVEGTGDVVGPASATTDHLAVFADETGKLLKDGGAPGGGGSFLSANTARVDPSGNNATGEVGDLTKAFTTQAAAIAAFEAATLQAQACFIYFNGYYGAEELTTDLQNLTFIGRGGNPQGGDAFSTLTLTSIENVQITGIDCALGQIASTSSLTVDVSARGALFYPVTSGGTLSVFGPGCITPFASTDTTLTGTGVTVSGFAHPRSNSLELSIVCDGGDVVAKDCVIKNITALNVTLIDSDYTGTLTLGEGGSIQYQNVLCPKRYDFIYDATVDEVTGSIAMRPLGETEMPVNFVITGAILEVITPLDSENHLATGALGVVADDDLLSATLVSSPPWSVAGLTALELSALVKTTVADVTYIANNVEPFTEGKFTLHIDGYLAQA